MCKANVLKILSLAAASVALQSTANAGTRFNGRVGRGAEVASHPTVLAGKSTPLGSSGHVPQITGTLWDNQPDDSNYFSTTSAPRTMGADEMYMSGNTALIDNFSFGYLVEDAALTQFDVQFTFYDDFDFNATTGPAFSNQVAAFTVPVTGATTGAFATNLIDLSALPGGGIAAHSNEANTGVPDMIDLYMTMRFVTTGTSTPVANNGATFLFHDGLPGTGFSFGSPELSSIGGGNDFYWRDADGNGTIIGNELRNFAAPTHANFATILSGTSDGTPPAQISAEWANTGGGDFHTASNWNPDVPTGFLSAATFGTAITAPSTVTLNANVNIGSLNFNNSNKYTIDGTGVILLGGPEPTINQTLGSHDINAGLATLADTTITVASGTTLKLANVDDSGFAMTKAGSGTLVMNRTFSSNLRISSGTLQILANGTDTGACLAEALTMITNTTLDLNDNDMIVAAATAQSTIELKITQARNNGSWDARGITSTAARNNTNHTTGLGVITGAEYTSFGHTGTFDGIDYFDDDTLIKYTWNGDTNFSGTVNLDDYVRIDIGFNTLLTGWSNGDFNYSGVVNFDDYVMIDTAFNTQSGTLGRAMSYLSGDDRSAAGLDDPAVAMVVQHFGQFGVEYAQHFLASVPEPTLSLGAMMLAGSMLARGRRRTRAS